MKFNQIGDALRVIKYYKRTDAKHIYKKLSIIIQIRVRTDKIKELETAINAFLLIVQNLDADPSKDSVYNKEKFSDVLYDTVVLLTKLKLQLASDTKSTISLTELTKIDKKNQVFLPSAFAFEKSMLLKHLHTRIFDNHELSPRHPSFSKPLTPRELKALDEQCDGAVSAYLRQKNSFQWKKWLWVGGFIGCCGGLTLAGFAALAALPIPKFFEEQMHPIKPGPNKPRTMQPKSFKAELAQLGGAECLKIPGPRPNPIEVVKYRLQIRKVNTISHIKRCILDGEFASAYQLFFSNTETKSDEELLSAKMFKTKKGRQQFARFQQYARPAVDWLRECGYEADLFADEPRVPTRPVNERKSPLSYKKNN